MSAVRTWESVLRFALEKGALGVAREAILEMDEVPLRLKRRYLMLVYEKQGDRQAVEQLGVLMGMEPGAAAEMSSDVLRLRLTKLDMDEVIRTTSVPMGDREPVPADDVDRSDSPASAARPPPPPPSSSSPPPRAPRKRRIMWTAEEEEALKRGVRELGHGKWQEIWHAEYASLHGSRRPRDLANKWRVMKRRRQV